MIKQRIHVERLFLLIVILWFYAMNICGQVSAQISIPFEIYDNAGGQKTLYFGLDQTATDAIDINLGESDLPPFPPIGAFEARWILPENNFSGSLSSWSDFRFAVGFPFSGTIEHRLKYQSAEGATIMYFSWNFPPEVTGLLQDLVNGTIVNVPINGNGVYELANFVVLNQLKLMIYYNNIVTEVEYQDEVSTAFKLEQNYPNPFNPATVIKFSISKEAQVDISVYNILGEKVRELKNEMIKPGYYEVEFNASNLASGVYLYRIKAGDFIESKKMNLLK
jgi:hypothetical protein